MTAKTRTGFVGDSSARGADPGTSHEQLIKDHRLPGRPEGASIHSFDEDPEEQEQAGEARQHRARDDQIPVVEPDPPKGEGPSVEPASGRDYQNPGQGPATDD